MSKASELIKVLEKATGFLLTVPPLKLKKTFTSLPQIEKFVNKEYDHGTVQGFGVGGSSRIKLTAANLRKLFKKATKVGVSIYYDPEMLRVSVADGTIEVIGEK